MKMKKVVAVVLVLCLMLSLSTVAFASYNDVPDGHWAASAIENWTKNGIFTGDADGNFNPSAYLTRAEAAAIMARLFKLTAKADISKYTDVKADAWYADYFALCVAAGIMNGTSNTSLDPTLNIPREQFFVMFARGLGLYEAARANVAIADDADISGWAKGLVYALVNGGYLKGTSATSTVVAPKDFINRASIAALLDQTISVYADAAGKFAYTGNGIALVVAANVSIVDAPAGTTVVTRCAPDATVNGVAIPETTVYIVPDETPAEEPDNGNQSGTPVTPVIPVIPKTHAQIIDEAVAKYVANYSSDYATLTKNGNTIKVEIKDPTVTIGKVYADIGDSILNAVKGQTNPAIITLKGEMDSQNGELAIAADTNVNGIHDLVYDVTGYAGNNTIGELDGKTINVSFVDADCAPFVYAFEFAVAK